MRKPSQWTYKQTLAFFNILALGLALSVILLLLATGRPDDVIEERDLTDAVQVLKFNPEGTYHIPPGSSRLDMPLNGVERENFYRIEMQRVPDYVISLEVPVDAQPIPEVMHIWHQKMIAQYAISITPELAEEYNQDYRMTALFLASGKDNVNDWIEWGPYDAERLLSLPGAKNRFERVLYKDALAWEANEKYVQALMNENEKEAVKWREVRDANSRAKNARFRNLLLMDGIIGDQLVYAFDLVCALEEDTTE